jgi:ABC-type nitrate/sulfonate/bicarbonate transport system substrate-binding protein
MTVGLRVGFMPLVDAALLVAAQREGFAEAEGLALELVREVSWANIRDRLNVGLFDAAHMLAPAAIATHLGLGQVQVDLAVPVALNLNGNAVTLSRPLAAAVAEANKGDPLDPAATARAMAAVVARRAAEGAPQLTLGHVFPYSTHHYQLRLWLQAGGLDPDRDLRLVVLPQAIRRILPALGNQFVYVLKMSSLVSVVGYQELTRRANELTLVEYRPLEIYTMLVLEYLALILVVSWLVRRLERRLAVGEGPAARA